MAKLPLYELLINEDEETGVDFIALVDSIIKTKRI